MLYILQHSQRFLPNHHWHRSCQKNSQPVKLVYQQNKSTRQRHSITYSKIRKSLFKNESIGLMQQTEILRALLVIRYQIPFTKTIRGFRQQLPSCGEEKYREMLGQGKVCWNSEKISLWQLIRFLVFQFGIMQSCWKPVVLSDCKAIVVKWTPSLAERTS